MSNETLIEKLRGYKSTPRHCEELCYEAANEIESMIQKLIVAHEESEFDHSEYKRLREDLRQQLADQREAFAVIAETPVSGEQDDITMEAKDRIAKAIRAWEPK